MIEITLDDLRTDVLYERQSLDFRIARAVICPRSNPKKSTFWDRFWDRVFHRGVYSKEQQSPETRIVLARSNMNFPDARQVRDHERLLDALMITPFGNFSTTTSKHLYGDPTWGPFSDLWVIYSNYKRVVVVYGWGFAESFLPWAERWKPKMYDQLLPYVGKIVVIEVHSEILGPEWEKKLGLGSGQA